MTIDINSFTAINDTRPGKECFRVFGTVTVAHPGLEPVLTQPKIRHKGGWEVLTLDLVQHEGPNLAVEAQRPVVFERPGATSWKMLEIQGCEGRLMIVTIE
jgi:hypothetical protein